MRSTTSPATRSAFSRTLDTRRAQRHKAARRADDRDALDIDGDEAEVERSQPLLSVYAHGALRLSNKMRERLEGQR